jgi:cell division protein FtsL
MAESRQAAVAYTSLPSPARQRSRKRSVRRRPAIRQYLAAGAAIMLIFAICLTYTGLCSRAYRLSDQLSAAQQQATELQQQNKNMELKVAQLQSPGRVSKVATKKLGMIEPANYLVAELPSATAANSQKMRESTERESVWTRLTKLAAHCLLPEAEASTR